MDQSPLPFTDFQSFPSTMFQFNPSWDIGHDDYKEIMLSIDSNKMVQFSSGTQWPLFKTWLTKRLSNFIDTDKFAVDAFKDATEVNKIPRRFAAIVEKLIRAAFTTNFLKNYDEDNGVEMFLKMNRRYSNLGNFDKIKLLRSIINPEMLELNDKDFKEKISLLSSHFAAFKSIAPYVALLKLKNRDVAKYLRTNNLAGNSTEITNRFSNLSINDIFRDIHELKDEGLLTDENETVKGESTDDEANLVLAKIKCFNCGLLGHFSRNCRKPRKPKTNSINYEGVQLVECPLDYDINFDKDADDEEINLVDEFTHTKFVLDSGATTHVVNDAKLLSDIKETNTVIKGVNGNNLCKLEGTVKINSLTLKNAKFIPNSPRNIISLPKLTDNGYNVKINGSSLSIHKDDKLISNSEKTEKLWFLTPNEIDGDVVLTVEDEIKQLHDNNGHCSLNQMKSLCAGVYSVAQIKDVIQKCETCSAVLNKTNKRTTSSNMVKNEQIGEYISADIIGPINGSYGLIVGEHKSSFLIGQILKSKAEASDKLMESLRIFTNLLNLTNKSLCFIRTDNEFNTNKFKAFCAEKGLIHQLTAPHSSFQNGNAENKNKQIEHKMKQLLTNSNIPNNYWNFAFRHAIFLHNYLPLNNHNQSPWEMLRETKKVVNVTIPFGVKIFAYNHNNRQKIFKKDINGTFLGFNKTTKIAFILERNTNKIYRSSSFKAINNIYPFNSESPIKEPFTTETTSNHHYFTPGSTIENSNETDSEMKEVIDESSTSNESTESDIQMTQTNSTDTNLPNDNPVPDMSINTITSNISSPIELEANDQSKELTVSTQSIVKPKLNLNRLPMKTNLKHVLRITKPKHHKYSFKRNNSRQIALRDLNDNLNLLSNEPIIELVDDDDEEDTVNDMKLLTNSSSDEENVHELHLLVDKKKYSIPTFFSDVIKSKEKQRWLEAIDNEMNSIKSNNVFSLVDRKTVTDKIVKGKWVFNVKQETNGAERFKARLVAKGFLQELGHNYVDVYAPVMKFDTLRLMLTLAAINNYKINQLDAKTAFLNGDIDYTVYLDPPTGTSTPADKIWKLNKGLYGLKQAPHIWFNTIKDVLVNDGNFSQSLLDPCLFFKKDCLISIYVDDILIAGSNQTIIDAAKSILIKKFTMKDMGQPKLFLGINIDQISNGFRISLNDFISKVQSDFDVEKLRDLKSPLAKGFEHDPTSKALDEKEHSKYRSIVGTLAFMANTVRFDISFAVSFLSRFLANPTKHHLSGAIRVLQYVCQTKDFHISYVNNNIELKSKDFRYLDKTENTLIKDYPKQGNMKLTVVSDSDFASDKESRKSQSGYFTLLNGNILSWSSKKQSLVALSSTEAEYIALTEATKSGIFFKNILKELFYSIPFIDLLGDNLSSLTLSAHPYNHNRSKHIDIKYHYIRQQVNNKSIKLLYINTKDNISDLLTKILDTTTFQNLLTILK